MYRELPLWSCPCGVLPLGGAAPDTGSAPNAPSAAPQHCCVATQPPPSLHPWAAAGPHDGATGARDPAEARARHLGAAGLPIGPAQHTDRRVPMAQHHGGGGGRPPVLSAAPSSPTIFATDVLRGICAAVCSWHSWKRCFCNLCSRCSRVETLLGQLLYAIRSKRLEPHRRALFVSQKLRLAQPASQAVPERWRLSVPGMLTPPRNRAPSLASLRVLELNACPLHFSCTPDRRQELGKERATCAGSPERPHWPWSCLA